MNLIDTNILSITINDNQLKDVQLIIKNIKNNFKYLKLKSANIESNKSIYIFWYDIEENKSEIY